MKPKKSLGQNFLRDKKALADIIESANLIRKDLVIEVGPGEGVLTEQLLKNARKVIAIEIDKELAKRLQEKFKDTKNFELISGDILEINLPKLIEEQKVETEGYKVVANIPYYITSPIIRLFLETKYPPKEMILMTQREVAERICASPGKMSILAVSVQYYAIPELQFTVPRTAFFPVPEVDSAVIKITHKMEQLEKDERKSFFRVLRAGFSAKRKTMANNLSTSLGVEKKIIEKTLQEAGISPAARAQELSVTDWKKIFQLF